MVELDSAEELMLDYLKEGDSLLEQINNLSVGRI